MTGHGEREERLRAEAIAWHRRVSRDMTSAAGVAVMCHCKTSIDVVAALADRIAGLAAAGEWIEVPRGRSVRAVAFMITRGHIVRVGENHLRPIRDGELI
jgi:hypothetical protein